eukprot:8675564-Heterocapsa_arctica.AAC.1
MRLSGKAVVRDLRAGADLAAARGAPGATDRDEAGPGSRGRRAPVRRSRSRTHAHADERQRAEEARTPGTKSPCDRRAATRPSWRSMPMRPSSKNMPMIACTPRRPTDERAAALGLHLAAARGAPGATDRDEVSRAREADECLHADLVFERTRRRSGEEGPVTPGVAGGRLRKMPSIALKASRPSARPAGGSPVLSSGLDGRTP